MLFDNIRLEDQKNFEQDMEIKIWPWIEVTIKNLMKTTY